MNATVTAPNIPPNYYGTVAFQIINNLMVLLVKQNVLANSDRAGLLNDIAAGLNPPNDPHVVAMRQFLKSLAAMSP